MQCCASDEGTQHDQNQLLQQACAKLSQAQTKQTIRGLLESSRQMTPSRKVRLGAACNSPHADPALGGYKPPIRRNRRSTPRAVLSPLPHQLAMLLPTQTGEREVNKQAVTPEQQEQASQVNAPKTANEDGENPCPTCSRTEHQPLLAGVAACMVTPCGHCCSKDA
jgi:hypothetical protein